MSVGRVAVALSLLSSMACTPPRRREPTPRVVVDVPVVIDVVAVDVPPPLPMPELAPAVDGGSTCDCPAFTDCRVVRRRALAGEVARELGLRLAGGAFVCDQNVIGCRSLPAASGAEVWELTQGCGFWTDRLLVIGRDVYNWQPMSVGERGGPGWSLARTRVEDPRTLRPLGMHFLADARRVYREGPVARADVATFRVLACPVETSRCLASDRTADFYEDDRGWSVERVPR